jgi:hypothetical protein
MKPPGAASLKGVIESAGLRYITSWSVVCGCFPILLMLVLMQGRGAQGVEGLWGRRRQQKHSAIYRYSSGMLEVVLDRKIGMDCGKMLGKAC